MSEAKKSGKVLLRGVDGIPVAGVCLYSTGPAGFEATISAQLPDGGVPMAVLQYGPEKGYACRPPEGISAPVRCGDAGIAAVWVVSAGGPALFSQIRSGAFDAAEARRKLQDALQTKPAQQAVKAAGLPAGAMVRPANREPVSAEQAVPFPSASAPGRFVYPPKDAGRPPSPQAKADEPILLLQPGPQPPQKGAEPKPEGRAAAAPAWQPAKAPPPAAHAVKAASVPAAQAVKTAPAPMAKPHPAAPLPPLVVRRAPRPTPRPPVYSPLWDDVSGEFEKMLDTLPQAHPFGGESTDARIAEVPTNGAVQCYVGSVEVDGMKIFLQAVPARPYARPAGFDHSLVSRSGECYWVKYFIQND